MKNEDKIGQQFILKIGQSRTEKFEKEDKVGQESLKKSKKLDKIVSRQNKVGHRRIQRIK